MLNIKLMLGIISMAFGIGIIIYLTGDVRDILGLSKRRRVFTNTQSGIKIDINSVLFYLFFTLVLFSCIFILWLFMKF